MLRCWDSEPVNRPTFTALTLELEQLSTRATIWGEDLDDCVEEGSVESAVPAGKLHVPDAASCIIEDGAVYGEVVNGDPIEYELELVVRDASSGSDMYVHSSVDLPSDGIVTRSGGVEGGVQSFACSQKVSLIV
jgi:hypothetical protein